MVALRPDERFRVRLAPVKLAQHLVSRVAATGAVPGDLPAPPQVFWRVQVDPDVEHLAQLGRMVHQQPFGNHEPGRAQVDGRPECAVDMLVDRLEYGFVLPEMPDVAGQDVHVIASRVERRETALGALPAVVAVIVVGAEVRDLLLPKHPDHAPSDRRLPGARITNNAQHDRSRHHALRSEGWLATKETT